jgi:hypothetical protein
LLDELGGQSLIDWSRVVVDAAPVGHRTYGYRRLTSARSFRRLTKAATQDTR